MRGHIILSERLHKENQTCVVSRSIARLLEKKKINKKTLSLIHYAFGGSGAGCAQYARTIFISIDCYLLCLEMSTKFVVLFESYYNKRPSGCDNNNNKNDYTLKFSE